MERSLASIQTITNINDIPGADNIKVAKILGWNIVVRKDEYAVGDKVIYCEIDSVLPPKPEFAFMESRKYRVRTIRLRGQISQGLCLPVSLLPNGAYYVGDDVTELMGIRKYEPPIPEGQKARLCGRARGTRPWYIPKTDEMRVQSIPHVIARHVGKVLYVTEKLDGTSMSIWYDKDTGLHVCSREMDLAPDNESKYNGTAYWDYVNNSDVAEVLKQFGNVAFQGELVGPGIQKNKYGLKNLQYHVYNVVDLDNHVYMEYQAIRDAVEAFGIPKDFLVPYLGEITLDHTVDQILELAKGTSVMTDIPREGIVLRATPETTDFNLGRLSFKAINNDFLEKFGE
jgi:RNA ligase (TIGR02306 family)